MSSASAVRLSSSVQKQKLKLELLRRSRLKLESLPVSVVVHEHLVRAGCMFFGTATRRTLTRLHWRRLDSLHVARPRPDGARPSCIQERCETLVGRRCGELVVFILAVLLSSSSQLLRVTVLSRSRGQSRHVCFNKVFSPPPRLLQLALTMAVTRRRLSDEKL